MNVTSTRKDTQFIQGKEQAAVKAVETQEYDKNGRVIDRDGSKTGIKDKSIAFCRLDINHTTDNTTYTIMEYDGALFDPYGTNGFRVKSLDTNMRRVSKNVFDFYMIYLRTRISVHLTKAQREFLSNDGDITYPTRETDDHRAGNVTTTRKVTNG